MEQRREMGWLHRGLRVLFFSIGCWREYRPHDPHGCDDRPAILLEPANARACRRNILALASVVSLAGLVGADPRDLRVLGVMPGDDAGIAVLAAAICLIYAYWYVQLYLHLTADGKVDGFAAEHSAYVVQDPDELANRVLRRRDADLVANWTALLLVLVSLYFAGSWAAKAFS